MRYFSRNSLCLGIILGFGLAILIQVYGDIFLAYYNCLKFGGCEASWGTMDPDNKHHLWELAARFISNDHNLISLFSLIVSGVAVYLVHGSLKATQKALKVSEGMAEDTREIGKAQTRAHLTITSVKFTFSDQLHTESLMPSTSRIREGQPYFSPTIGVEIENFGNTIAEDVVWTPSVKYTVLRNIMLQSDFQQVFSFTYRSDKNFPLKKDDLRQHINIPAQTAYETARNFSYSLEKEIFLSQSSETQVLDTSVYVVIALGYRDIFGDIHLKEYGFMGSLSLTEVTTLRTFSPDLFDTLPGENVKNADGSFEFLSEDGTLHHSDPDDE